MKEVLSKLRTAAKIPEHIVIEVDERKFEKLSNEHGPFFTDVFISALTFAYEAKGAKAVSKLNKIKVLFGSSRKSSKVEDAHFIIRPLYVAIDVTESGEKVFSSVVEMVI